jgi:hypothetical protein
MRSVISANSEHNENERAIGSVMSTDVSRRPRDPLALAGRPVL